MNSNQKFPANNVKTDGVGVPNKEYHVHVDMSAWITEEKDSIFKDSDLGIPASTQKRKTWKRQIKITGNQEKGEREGIQYGSKNKQIIHVLH